MDDIVYKEREMQINPYVLQVDKISESLKNIAKTIHIQGNKVQETSEIIIIPIAQDVECSLCKMCEYYTVCEVIRKNSVESMVGELIQEINEYGTE